MDSPCISLDDTGISVDAPEKGRREGRNCFFRFYLFRVYVRSYWATLESLWGQSKVREISRMTCGHVFCILLVDPKWLWGLFGTILDHAGCSRGRRAQAIHKRISESFLYQIVLRVFSHDQPSVARQASMQIGKRLRETKRPKDVQRDPK